MEADLNGIINGSHLNCFINGRRPKFCVTWKTTSTLTLLKDDLNFFGNGKRAQLNIFNLRRLILFVNG